MNQKPPIFIITGPSGVGKTTIAHALLRRFKWLQKVTTHTTRTPRPGEIDGRDYHFVTPVEFEKKIKANEFLEHATVYGDSYGTAWKDVDAVANAGHAALFVVDVQGAKTLKRKLKTASLIFLAPDSLQSLRTRIGRRRSNETPEQLERRMKTATDEMASQGNADHIILNRQGERPLAIRAVAHVLKSKMQGR